ncbi:double-strand break repair protein AddB [Sphingomonas sp. CFBP 13720]|uniref:double-strand break repair protein AddB n=1 Tax=Sphingomonas sp. CFBP 13720 TaxID=2775302 RepID=UPI00177F82E7|nr:double-strand break repair protein AddB [Sphingomonas sp. CFBP 13720]MBD8677517.1 double-strand break repair protein AddB [Sphingomonas sp. CFBP 13720]
MADAPSATAQDARADGGSGPPRVAAKRLGLYTIPIHRAFADALAVGLVRRFGGDRMRLAQGVVLVPTNRAKRTIQDAFVRASGGGLLLPRLVAIGDPEVEEAAGAFADPADDAPIPPAIEPLARRMILARLVAEERQRAGRPIDGGEAVRLAGDLARTLDQLLVEEVPPHRLRDIVLDETLSAHWERSLELFRVVLDRWPGELAALGRIDLADRRTRLLRRLCARWSSHPPRGFVCSAGITTTAPAVAGLLRCIAGMERGMIVLPGLDTAMADEEWAMLGPHDPDPVTGRRRRSIETHPQFHMKVLLDRMGVNRAEFVRWQAASEHDATPTRSRAIATALAPADRTHHWIDVPAADRRLSGVRMVELATPAEEAQAIAIALREALETPGRTAALVTPDRALARRVAAHCARWDIRVDDSAGQALSVLAPGTLLLALVEAAAQGFAPVALLALLKHPLVRSGDARVAWLDGVRRLDRALRGPRPAPGLAGIDRHLREGEMRDAAVREQARPFWEEARALLEPLAAGFAAGSQPPAALLALVRETATALAGDAAWSRPEGRAAAELIATLEAESPAGPPSVDPQNLPAMLRTLLDEVAVRPPQGEHPRLAILGLLEARLQTADLMILGGLNEGVWPALPAPDPWLAPRIRQELGLPGLERRIGLSAHDFASALGGREVVLTRAARDATAPTIASRLWLRLQALDDGLERVGSLRDWARAIDTPEAYRAASRPAPKPPVALRPRRISVTEVDRLKADPYAFYARRMLRLSPMDAVDADPTAAWRGTAVHGVLERWAVEDGLDPVKLQRRLDALRDDPRTHPLLRALWVPRLREAIDWVAGFTQEKLGEGRSVIGVESDGVLQIAGVELRGKADRIDRAADGTLAIIDYKTGKAPSAKAVAAGYSLQLGLLGLIAERGGFPAIAGIAGAFEYWSLTKDGDSFGKMTTPVSPDGSRGRVPTAEFVARAKAHFEDAVARFLTGDEAFTAKLVPEYAPYAEYDQLMRRDEWYGRE